MEEVKMVLKDDIMTIEGEFDIELELSCIHPGYPPEDENFFNKTAFEIMSYGEINLKYLQDMVKWVNQKSASRSPSEWPRWRVTFERL